MNLVYTQQPSTSTLMKSISGAQLVISMIILKTSYALNESDENISESQDKSAGAIRVKMINNNHHIYVCKDGAEVLISCGTT